MASRAAVPPLRAVRWGRPVLAPSHTRPLPSPQSLPNRPRAASASTHSGGVSPRRQGASGCCSSGCRRVLAGALPLPLDPGDSSSLRWSPPLAPSFSVKRRAAVASEARDVHQPLPRPSGLLHDGRTLTAASPAAVEALRGLKLQGGRSLWRHDGRRWRSADSLKSSWMNLTSQDMEQTVLANARKTRRKQEAYDG
ncbi:hypothetical protein EJB05_43521, partial [Eragrostis curvula]